MKKALTLIAILCMAAMLFAGCGLLPLPSEPTEPPVTEEPTTPACEHNWVDATCTAAKTCSKCGTTEGAPSGHAPGTEATCTNAQVCTVCNAELVAAKGHTAGAEATCTEAQICTVCNAELVAAKGHKDEDKNFACDVCKIDLCTEHKPGAEATCTEPQRCTACQEILVAAKGHTAGAEATCTNAQVCTVCNAELVAAKGHKPGAEATCAEPQRCTACQEILAAAKGHTAGADATCTTAQTCTVCNAELIAAKGHTAGADATCTTAQTCTVCNAELVASKGHTAGADATCTTAQTCTVCNAELVAAKGHTAKADDGDVTTAVTCERCDHIFVEAKEAIDLTIDTFENGAVVTDKKNYAVGEKVTLTITPADGYAQKLYINGEPLMLGWKTNIYSFTAEEGKTYAITGSFEPGLKLGAADKWDAANQAHGILNTYYTSGDSGWYWIDGEYASLSAIVKNYDSANADGFFTMLCFKINNVNYNFRVIKQGGKYYCQRAGFKVNGKDSWTKYELDQDTIDAILGEGVEFKMVRTAADTLTVSVNGKVYDVFTLTGDAVNAKVTKVCIGHDGNRNLHVTIPFELRVPSDEPPVENDVKIEIPAFTNGTVATNKESYAVGETVVLTVTPADGYSQKLYINDEPLMLDWKTNVYSFVAEEGKTYTITGSFEPNVFTGNDKWDTANQAHGVLKTYYTSGDAGWFGVNGEYKSISMIAKNYDETEANAFGAVLIFKINNKNYNFRITLSGGKYYCQRMGFAKKADGKDDWTKFELDADAVAAIRGEGAEFKMEHNNGVLTLSVNGKVYDTYTLPAADSYTVSRASLCSEGNKSLYVTVPFELTPVAK